MAMTTRAAWQASLLIELTSRNEAADIKPEDVDVTGRRRQPSALVGRLAPDPGQTRRSPLYTTRLASCAARAVRCRGRWEHVGGELQEGAGGMITRSAWNTPHLVVLASGSEADPVEPKVVRKGECFPAQPGGVCVPPGLGDEPNGES